MTAVREVGDSVVVQILHDGRASFSRQVYPRARRSWKSLPADVVRRTGYVVERYAHESVGELWMSTFVFAPSRGRADEVMRVLLGSNTPSCAGE